MARELSETLENQQKWGLYSHPYVKARITKRWGGVVRYDWDSLYSGSEEDYLHCAAMPGDGSLIRLRVTGAPAWISPTGGSGTGWTLTTQAYDEDILTGAKAANIPDASWTNALELTHAALLCSKIQLFLAGNVAGDQVDIDVFYGAAWHDVYEGTFTLNAWLEKSIPAGLQTVTAMRVRLYNSQATEEDMWLNEADFWTIPAAHNLYYQRVTSPAPESDFSPWTSLSKSNVIAVASCSREAKVSQFYINSSKAIYHRESTDNGANWGAWSHIGDTITTDIRGADADYKPNGDLCLFVAEATDVRYLERTTGSWGSYSKWDKNPIAWFTPTSHNDPESKWNDPTFAYDNDLETWAYATVPGDTWSEWLELLRAEASYARIRFLTVKVVQDECELQLFYGGEWHSVFLGSDYLNYEWKEINLFDTPTVSKARYKGHTLPGWLDKAILYEFDFGVGSWDVRELTGISVCYDGDWCVVITGKDASENPTVWSFIRGDGDRMGVGTWSDLEIIVQRGSTEPFTYSAPFLAKPDVYRLHFVENHTEEEITDRVFYTHQPPGADFADNAWLEPVPQNITTTYGVAITGYTSHAWLTNANSVYRAGTDQEELLLTARLLEVDSRDYPDIFKGSLKVVIDNTGGWYDDFDRLGQQLEVGFGYLTSAGYESSLVPFRWITKFKLQAPPWYPLRMIFPTGVIGTLKIETEDAWTFLYRYRTRRPLEWAAGTKSVKELLQFFIARAGLEFGVISQSDAAQNFKPEFEVRAGTSYRTAIKNLLKMVPDQLVFREAKVLLRNPTTEEAVDWTYHTLLGTALLVFRGDYGQTAWDPNRAEVWGDTFMKESANWPQVATVRDRLVRVTTPTYPDIVRAAERAEAELRRSEILTGGESYMTAPVNCGLEPWDVLQITDLNAGVTAIRRRVLRVKAYWNARHWSYQQVITLGAD